MMQPSVHSRIWKSNGGSPLNLDYSLGHYDGSNTFDF